MGHSFMISAFSLSGSFLHVESSLTRYQMGDYRLLSSSICAQAPPSHPFTLSIFQFLTLSMNCWPYFTKSSSIPSVSGYVFMKMHTVREVYLYQAWRREHRGKHSFSNENLLLGIMVQVSRASIGYTLDLGADGSNPWTLHWSPMYFLFWPQRLL